MPRPHADQVKHVACIGTGTIGAGWAAYFLSRGLDVVATDPHEAGEERLNRFIDNAWPRLEILGLAPDADRARLRFVKTAGEAAADAEFIQESAPDRLELKQRLFAEIDEAARADVVIASSSSEYLPSDIASSCGRPQRCIVGHPFAPSYLMPLVEVVGGQATTAEVMDWAMAFYTHIGKKALRLNKEIEAYVANRLQFAVWEEMNNLVEQGVCDFDGVDTAMRFGPGLRWAFAGPVLCMHMGGGQGGLRGYLEHFPWKGPPALEEKVVAEVDAQYGHLSMDEIEAWRDANLLAMFKRLKTRP